MEINIAFKPTIADVTRMRGRNPLQSFHFSEQEKHRPLKKVHVAATVLPPWVDHQQVDHETSPRRNVVRLLEHPVTQAF